MNHHTLFNTLLQYLNVYSFHSILGQHQSNKRAKVFSVRKTFMWLMIGQITQSKSIRDLERVLHAHQNKLYHMWMKWFARSTFSDWINKTPSLIFEQAYYHLLKQSQTHWWSNIYAIDSTLVPLTLSIFDRAYYRKKKWAIKIHTRIDIETAIPDLIVISEWRKNDSKTLTEMTKDLGKWDIIVIDRWYFDFEQFAWIDQREITFVTRLKSNIARYKESEIMIDHPQVLKDYMIELEYPDSRQKYSKPMRLIHYLDKDSGKIYEFLTNNTELSAIKIADLYHKRREIEKFFKRIKQNLKIKSFFWTSRNAVESQVWVAMIYYLLVYIIKSKTQSKHSLHHIACWITALLFHNRHFLDVFASPKREMARWHEPPPLQWLFFVS